jgi:hypothetical protein
MASQAAQRSILVGGNEVCSFAVAEASIPQRHSHGDGKFVWAKALASGHLLPFASVGNHKQPFSILVEKKRLVVDPINF